MQLNIKKYWVICILVFVTNASCGENSLTEGTIFCDTFVKSDRNSRYSEFVSNGKSIESLVIKNITTEVVRESGRLTSGESIVSDEIKLDEGTIWIGADHSNISKREISVGLFFTAETTNTAELISPGSFERIIKFEDEFYVISNTLDSHGGGNGIISIFGFENNIFFLKEVIKSIDVRYENLQVIDDYLVMSGYNYRNRGGFAKRLNGTYLTCDKSSN